MEWMESENVVFKHTKTLDNIDNFASLDTHTFGVLPVNGQAGRTKEEEQGKKPMVLQKGAKIVNPMLAQAYTRFTGKDLPDLEGANTPGLSS